MTSHASRTVGRALRGLVLVLAVALVGCGEGEEKEHEEEAEAKSEHSDLTAFELENGIGPVKEKVELGAIDNALVEQGRAVFDSKCSMCHKMDTTYVGPALGEVTARRTPAYIMNMILNPQEMVERHPIAKQLLAERMTFMPNQQVSREDARALVEYLRARAGSNPKP